MKNNLLKKVLFSMLTALMITLFIGSTVYGAAKPTISKASFDLLIGKTYDLDIKNATKNATFTWSTSNKKIATVNKNGLVKAVAKGTATITCKVKTSGKTYSLSAKVTVIAPAKSVSVTDKEIQLKTGKSSKLGAKITPSSSNDKITWTSADKSIAAVDTNGKVTAKKAGLTKITATSMSGKKATVTVAVYDDSVQRITAADIDDNKKILIKDKTISNLYIDAMDAGITLDHVVITGTLTVEAGINDTILMKGSTIASIKVVMPEDSSSVKDNERPTLIGENKTSIWEADLQGSCVLKRTDTSDILDITISPEKAGDYDVYLSAYQGNLKVNYASDSTVRVEMEGCNIATADILKASGDYLVLTDNVDNPSGIGTVNLKVGTTLCLDTATDTLNIDKSLKDAQLLIANTINKLVSNGNNISFFVSEEAHVKELIDNKDSSGNYGSYKFKNSELGNFSFTVYMGIISIEDIRLKDFVKILDAWVDKSKPYEIPEIPGVRVKFVGKDAYQLDIFGVIINLAIDPDAGTLTIFGSDIFRLIDIKTA